ncbi:MAG TPA: GNAT family N-acetyltransferase [Nocardioidaceae bacterium]|nr:GNAT family N-acetyltransferase [Nocardioidaceae bacterium]
MSEPTNVTVTDNADKNRYEAADESGVVSGFVTYEKREGLLIFTHAEVDDAVEGLGVGSALARGALDQARTTGLQVRPACPFIADYIDNHPEYQDMLTG